MKKLSPLALLCMLIMAFTTDNSPFTGQIKYRFSFTDLDGKPLSDSLIPSWGMEKTFYINNKSYKAYNEMGNWVQLYNSDKNVYYSFYPDKSASKSDASVKSAGVSVQPLSITDTVIGYPCKAVQVSSPADTTVYFYSDAIKTDTASFMKHNLNNWNVFLRASGGALPLKTVSKNAKKGYIWTSVATNVTKSDLSDQDFTFPDYIRLQ
jgi:hypothetical protein